MRHVVTALLLSAAPMAIAPAASHDPAAPVAQAGKPVPKELLLAPPATAEHYVIVSDSAKHGDVWVWTMADGSRAFRHSQSLRGWITETDAVVRSNAAGVPVAVTIRGRQP